jgi:agmatinase
VTTDSTTPPEASFLGAPVCTDLDALQADVAILGIPHGVPYDVRRAPSDTAHMPAAVRTASKRFARLIGHHDFDLGGDLLDGGRLRLVDCGDVPGDPRDVPGNVERATGAVRAILEHGALPIVLGGDDSIPPLVLRAYPPDKLFTVIQIDAHLDYRDEVDGIRDGYSSPMRRASELPCVERIVHVGLRGVGSARAEEVEASRARGNLLIRAVDLHEHGIDWLLAQLSGTARYFVTIDVDGLDPSIAPGTSAPLPGGLTFLQVNALLHGLESRGRIVGMDAVEYFPSRDGGGATAVVLTRLIANVIGLVARGTATP